MASINLVANLTFSPKKYFNVQTLNITRTMFGHGNLKKTRAKNCGVCQMFIKGVEINCV
jgi:hypothetical protein